MTNKTHTQGKITLTDTLINTGKILGEIPLMVGDDESAIIVCSVREKAGKRVVNPHIAQDAKRIAECWNNYDEVLDALVWAAPFIKDERVSKIVQAVLNKVKGW